MDKLVLLVDLKPVDLERRVVDRRVIRIAAETERLDVRARHLARERHGGGRRRVRKARRHQRARSLRRIIAELTTHVALRRRILQLVRNRSPGRNRR
mgnify:CR=1 FL=1